MNTMFVAQRAIKRCLGLKGRIKRGSSLCRDQTEIAYSYIYGYRYRSNIGPNAHGHIVKYFSTNICRSSNGHVFRNTATKGPTHATTKTTPLSRGYKSSSYINTKLHKRVQSSNEDQAEDQYISVSGTDARSGQRSGRKPLGKGYSLRGRRKKEDQGEIDAKNRLFLEQMQPDIVSTARARFQQLSKQTAVKDQDQDYAHVLQLYMEAIDHGINESRVGEQIRRRLGTRKMARTWMHFWAQNKSQIAAYQQNGPDESNQLWADESAQELELNSNIEGNTEYNEAELKPVLKTEILPAKSLRSVFLALNELATLPKSSDETNERAQIATAANIVHERNMTSLTQDILSQYVDNIQKLLVPKEMNLNDEVYIELHRKNQMKSLLHESKASEYLKDALVEKLNSCSNPAFLFPEARKLNRQVHLHIGPTNSGKTYTALQAFQRAESGYYAGPLRLLAREVYNRMKSNKKPCNLVTGDEIVYEYDADGNIAQLSSGTVEMININSIMDIAVIDEIQMLSDRARGWAWTQAFLAVQAREVHLCGDPNAEDAVRQLVKMTGDTLTVHTYERLGPLQVDASPFVEGSVQHHDHAKAKTKHTSKDECENENENENENEAKQESDVGEPESKALLRDIEDLAPRLRRGDCIVFFSKKRILAAKKIIEEHSKHKCAVIYGSLPAETRAVQAEQFNDPLNPAKILLASDAIGMGLNLAIRRVIFSTTVKFDGTEMVKLPIAQVKQVAGRAGRYKVAPVHGSEDPTEKVTAATTGFVTALNKDDVKFINMCMKAKSEAINHVYFYPPDWLIEDFALLAGENMALDELLTYLEGLVKLPAPFKFTDLKSMGLTAAIFRGIRNLTLSEKVVLAKAPVQLGDEIVRNAFFQFCIVLANGVAKTPIDIPAMRIGILSLTSAPNLLDQLESLHRILNLYLWLAYRFPTQFLDKQGARDLRNLCQERINDLLLLQVRQRARKDPRKTKSTSQLDDHNAPHDGEINVPGSSPLHRTITT